MEFKEQNQASLVQNLLPLCPTYKPHLSSTHLSNVQHMELLANNCLNLSQNPEWSSSFSSRSFFSNSQFYVPVNISSPRTMVSTLDEARETRVNIVSAKRLKRLISSRKSARRSRMRKKKLIEELQFQVNQVQTLNHHQLSEKLIWLLESNRLILQENDQLKEKVSSRQTVVSDLLAPLRFARS